MNKQADDVRRDVSKVYSDALAKPSGCGCGCARPVQKGVAAKLGGYTEEELAALPSDAVVNSFGCGNPVAFAELGAGDVVLDLGSGAGVDLLLAAKMVGPSGRVIGVDMTDDMIAKARKNIAEAGFANVEVRKGIIEELPVDAASVDWVISNCVINLSPEKHKVFREIARVLRPGGRMLVSDIVAEGLPQEVLDEVAFYSTCVAGAISEEQYLAGLQSAGLAEAEVRERLVYDAGQIASFVDSELSNAASLDAEAKQRLRNLAHSLAGKVWSAKIAARKPL